MTTFNVLIIGAGNIGAFYDTPLSIEILTHAHAFSTTPGFRLSGFVDKNKKKAVNAAKIWGGKAYESIEEVFQNEKIDIVCVCVSDESHYEILKIIASYPIKLVFCEKPFITKPQYASEIIDIYKKKHINITVNYTRRFVPEFELIRKNIIKEKYGKYITGTGYYGKGIFHNGVHMIDLLRFFLGPINNIKISDKIFDHTEADPSMSAFLTIRKGVFFMQAIDSRKFSIFEIDLVFEKARIKIINSGNDIIEYSIRSNKLYKNYDNLIITNEIKTSLNKALCFAVSNIYDYLIKKTPLLVNASEIVEMERFIAESVRL